MAKLAFLTFGLLRAPRSHPDVQGFVDRIGENYRSAENCDGFIDRSELIPESNEHSWGEFVPTRLAAGAERAVYARTLSRWADLESVYAFAYAGVHAEALKLRKEWFVEPAYPNYVAWWVEDGHIPDWREANERQEHLHDNGSSAFAFTFKQPFDAAGSPVELDREAVKQKLEKNRQNGALP